MTYYYKYGNIFLSVMYVNPTTRIFILPFKMSLMQFALEPSSAKSAFAFKKQKQS